MSEINARLNSSTWNFLKQIELALVTDSGDVTAISQFYELNHDRLKLHVNMMHDMARQINHQMDSFLRDNKTMLQW